MILTSWDRHRDLGLLILRIGIGLMFMSHGWPKLIGGVEKWVGVGGAMAHFGINFGFTFWGFMAAITEFGGGLMLILGFFSRPVLAALFFTMIVAAMVHFNMPPDKPGAGFKGAAHAIELGIVFFSLIFIGPGKYSLDEKLTKK